MANFNSNIAVTVTASAAAVERTTFGSVILITDAATGLSTGEIRRYTSSAAMAADSDLDSDTQTRGALFFAQTPNPGALLVGKVASGYASLAADLATLAADDTYGGFYGIALESRAEADILATALWAEANGFRLFMAQTSDAAVLAGTAGNVAEDLQGFGYEQTACLWYHDDTIAADLAWLAYKLSANPDETATIWAYTTLAGVTPTPNSEVDSTEAGVVLGLDANLYLTLFSVGSTGQGTTAAGTPIDETISRHWFEARAEERLAQVVLDTSSINSKVPYTDTGIVSMRSVVEVLFAEGVQIGHFEADSLEIQATELASVPTADKQARIMRLSGSLRLAGAIEKTAFTFAVLSA